MAVLLQNGDTEAMEGIDIPRILVPGEPVNPLPHLIRRLVGESHAEDISRQNSDLIDQKREPGGKRPGFPGSRPGDHPDHPFRGRHGLLLGLIEPFQIFFHWFCLLFSEKKSHCSTDDISPILQQLQSISQFHTAS